jgi:hypothetical protein
MPRRSECDLTEELILWLIEERADSASIQALLEAVVEEVPVLPFAVQIVLSCHGHPRRNFQRIHNHVDRYNLRRLAAERLAAYYVQGSRDILAHLPEDDWYEMLRVWGTDWMTFGGENRSVVQGYVLGLIDRKPEYLGLILGRFTDRSFGQLEGEFRYHDFCQLYDPSAMIERLDRYGDCALTSPAERRAADLFRQQYANSQQAQPAAETPTQSD